MVLALSLMGMVQVSMQDTAGAMAQITLEGTILREIDLSHIEEAQMFTVEGTQGSNTIAMEHGRIRVYAADCPDQLCVHKGWIDGGMIVCLPNRLVIRIGSNAMDAIDGVSQ